MIHEDKNVPIISLMGTHNESQHTANVFTFVLTFFIVIGTQCSVFILMPNVCPHISIILHVSLKNDLFKKKIEHRES